MTSKRLLLLSSAICAAAAFGGVARAQSTAPAPASQEGAQSVGSSQVVVTAEKRSANIQHVPIQISAFTSKTRDVLGIHSIQDLTNFVPGITYTATFDRTWIRGIGRNTNQPGTDGGVATFYDGFYNNSSYAAGLPPILTERVEVLSGPQGTLYGRNSIGGDINVISPRPTSTFYAEARVAVENYDHETFQGAVSGPITDWLKFRAAAVEDYQGQGYFHNVAGGPSEGGVKNDQTYDVQLDATFDQVDAWFHYNHIDTHQRNRTGVSTAPYTDGTGAADNAFGQSPEGFAASAWVNPHYGTADINPAIKDPYAFATDTPDHTTLTSDLADTNIVWHAPGVDVKYIGGWAHYIYTDLGDGDGAARGTWSFTPPTCGYGPLLCGTGPAVTIYPVYSIYQENKSWYSHELDFISTTQGPLQWVAGLYYYADNFAQIPLGEGTYSPQQTQLAHPCQSFFNSATFGYVCSPAAPLLNNPGNWYTHGVDDAKDENYAGFAQIDWKFADAWKFTAGLRYSVDNKTGSESLLQVNAFLPTPLEAFPSGAFQSYDNLGMGNPAAVGYFADSYLGSIFQAGASCINAFGGKIPGCTVTGPASRAFTGSWDGVSGTVGLEWQPDPDTLAYVKYSRGYKSGGFQLGEGLNPGPVLPAETLDDYELGLKKTIDKVFTLDTSLYYYNYLHDQDFTFVANPQGPNFPPLSLAIAFGKVRIYGADVLATWNVTPDFVLTGTYSYINDTILEAYQGAPAGTVGSATPGTPTNKFSISALYSLHFNSGTLTFNNSYSWRDVTYSNIPADAGDKAPAFGQDDIRLIWEDALHRYTVIGYVRNVFNDQQDEVKLTVANFVSEFLVPPRIYGVEFQYRFR